LSLQNDGGNDIEDEQALLATAEKQYMPISKEDYCKEYIDNLINGIVDGKENN
jgi:hypothetical protein